MPAAIRAPPCLRGLPLFFTPNPIIDIGSVLFLYTRAAFPAVSIPSRIVALAKCSQRWAFLRWFTDPPSIARIARSVPDVIKRAASALIDFLSLPDPSMA